MSDEVCGKKYRHGDVVAKCLRDAGHDSPDFRGVFWPPPKDEAERQEMLEAYREHGYEDRTPY